MLLFWDVFFTLVGIQIQWAGICYHVYISRVGGSGVATPGSTVQGVAEWVAEYFKWKKYVLYIQKILICWAKRKELH